MILFPYRCKNPPESPPIGTIALIAINVIVFALTSNFLSIHDHVVERWALTSGNFNPVNILTSMFLHGDLLHLLGNMWFLYLLGFAVEGRLRTLKFVILYLLAGVSGDLLHHIFLGASNPDIPSLGASGAIMGIMGAALYMFPFSKIEVYYRWTWFWEGGTFEVPMWGMGLWYLGQDLLFHFLSGGSDGVGHLAHLGGAVGGAFMAFALRGKRDDAKASDAKASLDEAKEYHRLPSYELAALSKTDPDNTYLALNWMYRCQHESKVTPEVMSKISQLFPKMIDKEDLSTLANCVRPLFDTPYAPSPPMLHRFAMKLEANRHYEHANFYYLKLIHDPRTSESDLESILFRAAQLNERILHQPAMAIQYYEKLTQRWPLGPFSDQARARLAELGGRISSS